MAACPKEPASLGPLGGALYGLDTWLEWPRGLGTTKTSVFDLFKLSFMAFSNGILAI